MKCVDEHLVEALDVVVVRRANDKGEGRLGLCKEIFHVLGIIMALMERPTFQQQGRLRGSAVVRAGTEQW